MKRASAGKAFLFILIGIAISAGAVAVWFFYPSWFQADQQFQNPLEGVTIVFDQPAQSSEVHIDDIEITTDFLSYLLNEISAWKLHKNQLTGEPAYVLFSISDKDFYSTVDDKIETLETSPESFEADMEITTTKEEIVRAIISEDSGEYFRTSIGTGKTTFNLVADQTTLFAKGYLDLYDALA